MTGTSMDGIDISLCSTDGVDIIKILYEKSYKYSILEQINIKNFNKTKIKQEKLINNLDLKVSKLIQKFLKRFLKDFNIKNNSVDYISMSGQTILHLPNKKFTLQIGDPQLIANYFKINVISNFRNKDISKGGQGAPIGAYYHKLLIKKINTNSVIINLGGVAKTHILQEIKFFPFVEENFLK